MKKIRQIPPPGLRNIKTSIAIFICLVMYSYIGREGAIFAVMAILICMQGSLEKTVLEGVFRVLGTILGAVSALVFLAIPISYDPILRYYFLCAIGMVIIIHTLYLLKMHRAISMAGIVYLVIILGSESSPFLYALDRTIDTTIGIVFAIIINHLMFRPTRKHEKQVNINVHDKDDKVLDSYTVMNYHMVESEKELTYNIAVEEFVSTGKKEDDDYDDDDYSGD